jgi:hypothetical protein
MVSSCPSPPFIPKYVSCDVLPCLISHSLVTTQDSDIFDLRGKLKEAREAAMSHKKQSEMLTVSVEEMRKALAHGEKSKSLLEAQCAEAKRLYEDSQVR